MHRDVHPDSGHPAIGLRAAEDAGPPRGEGDTHDLCGEPPGRGVDQVAEAGEREPEKPRGAEDKRGREEPGTGQRRCDGEAERAQGEDRRLVPGQSGGGEEIPDGEDAADRHAGDPAAPDALRHGMTTEPVAAGDQPHGEEDDGEFGGPGQGKEGGVIQAGHAQPLAEAAVGEMDPAEGEDGEAPILPGGDAFQVAGPGGAKGLGIGRSIDQDRHARVSLGRVGG